MVVSGASGLVGSAVRAALAEQSSTVVQLVRGKAEGLGQIAWNPAAEPAVAEPERLEGCAAALHFSGANLAGGRWTEAYKKTLRASRVETTRALARTLAALREPPKVLAVASAVGIYGNRGDEVLTESSARGSGFLAELCAAWEAAAEPAVAAGMRVVHLRLGVVLSKNGGALKKMLPLFRLGLGGRIGSGRQWMSWISLDDAVRAILFAVEKPEMTGAVNVVGPEPVTNAELTRVLARQLHRPAVLPAPAFALRLALGPMADEALLASTRAVPEKLEKAGFRFHHARLAEALAAELG